MHAIQRRTGGLDSIPDEFVITSLDVIIHHDKKLGQGGSGQVFQADWQGTTVAIKIFGKGVPSSVSHMSTPRYSLTVLFTHVPGLSEGNRCVEVAKTS